MDTYQSPIDVMDHASLDSWALLSELAHFGCCTCPVCQFQSPDENYIVQPTNNANDSDDDLMCYHSACDDSIYTTGHDSSGTETSTVDTSSSSTEETSTDSAMLLSSDSTEEYFSDNDNQPISESSSDEVYTTGGLSLMESYTTKLFGEGNSVEVFHKAATYFCKAISIQRLQKLGHCSEIKYNSRRRQNRRVRFARKQKFVFASIILAMKEYGAFIPGVKKDVPSIVAAMNQKLQLTFNVSQKSVKQCCSFIGRKIH